MRNNLLAEMQTDGYSGKRKAATRGGEWQGPCILPGCKGLGYDRLRVQPNHGQFGFFECRVCGERGSLIDWLILKRGYSMHEALKVVGWKPKDGSIPRLSLPRHIITGDAHPTHQAPCSEWQTSGKAFVDYSVNLLWSEQGQQALEYLRGRGLKDETIKLAQLGYNPTELLRPGVKWGREKPVKLWEGIVIPWFVGDELWRFSIRAETEAEGEARYKQVSGGSNGLYMAFSLHFDRPVVLVEGEFDALSVTQECGHHVSVVATGTTEGSHTAKWVGALASKDLVFVAFDADPSGDAASKWWLDRLESARRLRPWWGDANQMLQEGIDLLNDWVLPCIDPIQASLEDGEVCATCLDLDHETPATLEYEGWMYCSDHYPHTAKLELFSAQIQQSIPFFKNAKTQYWRKEDSARVKQQITSEYRTMSPFAKKPLMWDLINELETLGLLPEPKPIIYPDYWEENQKRLLRPSIPTWLTPGEDEWNKLIERVGVKEAKSRRRIALKATTTQATKER